MAGVTAARAQGQGHLNGFAPLGQSPVDIELFAGAGGLAVGLAQAGMAPDYLFELNKHCCATLRRNALRPQALITGEVVQADLTDYSWESFKRPVRLLSGGPPCQPFSLGGKHLAERDTRNRFADAIATIRALNPAVVLFENVPGLMRPAFSDYLNYLIAQMKFPSLAPKYREDWQHHHARLRKEEKRNGTKEYNVQCWVLNAADFGAPQVRVRVYLLATRVDLPIPSPPLATHSRAALQEAQLSASYWRKRGIRRKPRHEWPRRATCEWNLTVRHPEPWLTVREALAGLPEPREDEDGYANHWLIPGARLYARHSGSELDWPSKAIKSGVHGVSGGENVLRHDDGTYRYFSLREMARLQGFPDDYAFVGPRSRIIGQIGNAVPCQIGKMFGTLIRELLKPLRRPAPRSRTFIEAWR